MSAFLHPAMLWGLLLAAVPVIIHLLNRRRYRTVRWAAMDFLRAAYRKNQRRLRFENLLLLLLRTALIILLALALARPFLTGGVASALSDSTTSYTILLDNSYSMGLNEGVTSPFDRGVREALKIVGTMEKEDSLTLYLTNDNFGGARPGVPRSVFRDSHDADKARSVLGRLRVSSARSTLADSLAAVADRMDAKQPGKVFVIVTDLTRASWEAGEPGTTRAPPAAGAGSAPDQLDASERTLLDLFREIERKGARIQLIDVGSQDAANLAVTGLRPAENRPLIEGNVETFLATVRNYGRSLASVNVTFSVDGELKGSTQVEVPAAPAVGDAGEAIARFALPSIEAGAHTVSAEIPTDALTPDDERLYAAEVREKIRVLAVDGDPDGELSPETFYLKWAIAPRPDRIEVEDVDYLSFLARDLDDVDLVILANLERVREDKVRRLEEFVRGGGALVVFLGDKVDPELTNRNLVKEGEGLLPAVLSATPVTGPRDETNTRINLEAPPHPLLDGILGPTADPEGFWKALSPKVWGYYRLTVPEGADRVTILLRMTDAEESPALVEKQFGKGKVLLFATSADRDWSDFPAPGVSIPLLHEMVYYLTSPDAEQSNLTPFGTYALDLPERVIDVQVTTPDGGRVKAVPVLEEGRSPRLEFRETEEPGVYGVRVSVRGASAIDAGTLEAVRRFAVNVDGREGDLRGIRVEEIANRYPTLDLAFGRTFAGRESAEDRRSEGEIWKGLLVGVLVLLLAELLLARRFGDFARRIRREKVRS